MEQSGFLYWVKALRTAHSYFDDCQQRLANFQHKLRTHLWSRVVLRAAYSNFDDCQRRLVNYQNKLRTHLWSRCPKDVGLAPVSVTHWPPGHPGKIKNAVEIRQRVLYRSGNQMARSTLLERRHLVHAYTWQGVPLTTALTRLTLGFHARLERLWE